MLCVVVFVLCRPEKGERRREGGHGWLGKVPRSPAAPHKENGEKQADRKKVPDRPSGERGKAILKKKKLIGKIYLLKIVENNTKQPRLDCLSFFLDFVSATP
jgi:hypothetical protein